MSEHFLHDHIDLSGDTPKIVRKYINMKEMDITLKSFDIAGKGIGHYKPFHGQRVFGHVRLNKYVLRGLFADPNNYAV